MNDVTLTPATEEVLNNPGNTMVIICRTEDSSTLIWTSDEYIIDEYTFGLVHRIGTQRPETVNENTVSVANLTRLYRLNGSGPWVMESMLIVYRVKVGNSTITCTRDDETSKTITVIARCKYMYLCKQYWYM